MRLAAVIGAVAVSLAIVSAAAEAFVPTDPLASQQWYLGDSRMFDFWPEAPPVLPEVLVAIVDSGVDAGHPEFVDRITEAKSFVSGSAQTDTVGHGTMVAGELVAALDNGEGVAGAAFPAKLLVAKVVSPNGTIPLDAEASAIRWAADRGARVINLSLGGPRDPDNLDRDTYSAVEQSAIDYATSKGAVVVAATGNCQASCPYRYASYPAALPHVLGVSALAQNGITPAFSNRDKLYNDIAAPGRGIVSTFPRNLTDPACGHVGYSVCATVDDYRLGDGTSFAVPLVTAAAALLIAENPELAASQIVSLLEQNATDLGEPGHDRQTGWGRLDVTAALDALQRGDIPPPDALEPNDDAGAHGRKLGGRSTIDATLTRFDDPTDVYELRLRPGERVSVTLDGPIGTDTSLVLWKPRTESVVSLPPRGLVADVADHPGAKQQLRYRVMAGGWYYLQVKLARGEGGAYELALNRSY
jgi:serine protease